MNKYRVWINTINGTYIDVKAQTLESAKKKAKRKWQKVNQPQVCCVEKDGKWIFSNE